MRAGFVAAGYEARLGLVNRAQRAGCILVAANASRIRRWTHDDEIVVHNRMTRYPISFRNELRLRVGVVHEHHVSITAPGSLQRLAGALGNHLCAYASAGSHG